MRAERREVEFDIDDQGLIKERLLHHYVVRLE
jgi:hypothetical protein